MPLLKNGAVAADPWHKIVNGDALPPEGPVILPFERWRAERETLLGRNTPLGVRLSNTDPVAELAPDLDRLEIIVLDFPKFTDGRAYSQARLLRERHGYKHELRATGNVLRDQLLFMQRCGFDAVEIEHADPEGAWKAGLGTFSVFYQPTGDGRSPVERRRAASLEPV
jgi:uncharacterized protein (DUF934 family)